MRDRSDRKPWPGDGAFFFQAIGAALFAGAVGVLLGRAVWPDDPVQAFGLGFIGVLLGVYLLTRRYEGAWSSRRNPAPGEVYLDGRQRRRWLAAGCGLWAVSLFLRDVVGISEDSAAGTAVFGVLGLAIVLSLGSALFGKLPDGD